MPWRDDTDTIQVNTGYRIGFEMAQNSTKIKWTKEEVDQRLRQVMTDIHRNCLQAAERYGDPGNYFSGANIAGFIKVANAMFDQGNT